MPVDKPMQPEEGLGSSGLEGALSLEASASLPQVANVRIRKIKTCLLSPVIFVDQTVNAIWIGTTGDTEPPASPSSHHCSLPCRII